MSDQHPDLRAPEWEKEFERLLELYTYREIDRCYLDDDCKIAVLDDYNQRIKEAKQELRDFVRSLVERAK